MRRETFTVGDDVALDIELAAGTLLLRGLEAGSDPPGVVVSIDASTSDAFEIAHVAGAISVREGKRRRSARVVIDTPAGTNVTVRGASLEVLARGRLGSVRVRAASGDVTAEIVTRLDVTVASGNVRVDTVTGDANLSATSGDATAGSIEGRLWASLTSGDLRVGMLGGDAEVGSSSGDITIGRCDGSSISVRTQSGDVRVGLPSGIRVEPELSTMSGRVVVPSSHGPQPTTAERRAVRLRLRSVSGDITVERAR